MSLSEHLEADVNSSSIASFNVNTFVPKSLFIGSDLKYLGLLQYPTQSNI